MVFWLNRWRKVDSISFWWPILWVSSIRVAASWAFCSQARYSSVSNEIGTILKDMKWRHHKLRILEKIPSLTVKTRGGVELNRTNFELNFSNYFSPFKSIELQIFESNGTNFERIQFLIILLQPLVGVESNESNLN